MRFSYSPNAIILLFLISGRCALIDAISDHSVSEQQDDRNLGTACSNSCDTGSSAISDLVASLDIQVEERDDEEEDSGGIVGALLGRLMNGFFKLFNRRQVDVPKYSVRTENIMPLLSDSSTKFKALAELIQQESATDAALSTTPDAIRMLYNASAENMLLVATVLDPIVERMRLHTTMDLRSISCDLMTVLTLLRDITVPNIRLTAKLLYTKSDNADTKYAINQYIDASKLDMTAMSTASTMTSSRDDDTCMYAPNPAATSRTSDAEMSIRELFDFLFFDLFVGVGPIQNISNIILLIILFPVSVVLSIVVATLTILLAPILYILQANCEGPLASILSLLFLYSYLSPLVTLYLILENILEFFIVDPDPTPTRNFPPTFSPIPSEARKVHRLLLVVLDSPIKTIVKMLGKKNNLSDSTEEEKGQMDCEMSSLKCKADAVNEILPF